MRRWRDQPFRPWDALLSVPIIGILGVMACTLTAKPYGWSVFCVALSGAAIGAYLLIEWRFRRL